ncbi:MAG TPA: ABC transporter substrate-binding protein [Ferrovibrio sp.]|jgi:NitT/TauT family transport system substrate-binding protein|uniref:ABC transporter substrate-binding protein n=1 Tax=Ferrovibrio sp. TaxID=1917215 RepID=UPI002B4B5F65|nr:ABC transporter substrate-binding protein [Ferrovibrio sp.]HLT78737.1 ABC transporter substrate-binding protein [Ferrovibrio sp.]
MTSRRLLAIAVAAALLPAGGALAQAKDKVNLLLNWVPTADHSPYYYAKAQGWYEQAGLDVSIESGKGSGVSAQRVGAGNTEFAIADMATALVAKSKGADLVAVMTVYANSPQGFYWLKSSGITGPKDFPGRKLGNPPGDASRVMWPAFAKQVGIATDSVTFVNVTPQAKVASLKSKAIDITSDFYNEHDLKVREFGDDLGFVAWRNIGLNLYGNSIIVNGDYIAKNKDKVAKFVAVSQKAFAACVADVSPCLKALMSSVSGLDEANQRDQWNRIKELMTDPTTTGVALGAFDAKRMQADYEMVKTYFGMEKDFDIAKVYTNEFLDKNVKMTK